MDGFSELITLKTFKKRCRNVYNLLTANVYVAQACFVFNCNINSLHNVVTLKRTMKCLQVLLFCSVILKSRTFIFPMHEFNLGKVFEDKRMENVISFHLYHK